MTGNVFFGVLGVLFHIALVSSWVSVDLFKHGRCKGHKETYSFEWTCYNFPKFGYKISSVRMTVGSCLKIFKGLRCTGDVYMMSHPNHDLCDLPCCGWNDHVLSVQDCSYRSVKIECPVGSYVRQLSHGRHPGYNTEGLTIYCYIPGQNTPISSKNTHSKTQRDPIQKSCPTAATGFTTEFTHRSQLYEMPTLTCPRKLRAVIEIKNVTENPNMLMEPNQVFEGVSEDNATLFRHATPRTQYNCNEGEALTGLVAKIDEAGVFKEITPLCRKVPDPTTTCKPEEMLGFVMLCDNTESINEMECSYSKTIGVSEARSMTKSERQEMAFSMEFGFSVSAGIPGLSASMSAKLGMSKLVGYQWSRTDTSTWKEETTVAATIKLKPGTKTRLDQLIGKCSFYGAGTSYFKQTDVNKTTGEEKIKYFSV